VAHRLSGVRVWPPGGSNATMLDTYTIGSNPAQCAAPSTRSVPRTFTWRMRPASRLSKERTEPACTTASQSRTAWSTAAGSV
jgi:hypothetical protein